MDIAFAKFQSLNIRNLNLDFTDAKSEVRMGLRGQMVNAHPKLNNKVNLNS